MRAQSPFIISRPERQSGPQQAIFGALTVTIWALWLYLWLPLLTAILWMVGIHWAYIQVFKGARGVSLWVILWIMLATIIIVGYWSSYNNIRYAKKTQRRSAQAVSKSVIGEKFGITRAALSLLLRQRRLNLYFNDSEQLIHVDAVADASYQPKASPQPSLHTVALE
jgi:biofilm PGA synthesis protein PgaD